MSIAKGKKFSSVAETAREGNPSPDAQLQQMHMDHAPHLMDLKSSKFSQKP